MERNILTDHSFCSLDYSKNLISLKDFQNLKENLDLEFGSIYLIPNIESIKIIITDGNISKVT